SSLNENGNDNPAMDNIAAEPAHKTQQNAHLLQNKPWQVSQDQDQCEYNLPQLSRAHVMFENAQSSNMFDFMQSDDNVGICLSVDTQVNMVCEEAPVSPSAFRSYLSN